jgi:hypothetical protein
MTPRGAAGRRSHEPCAWSEETGEPTRPDTVQDRPDGGLVVRAHCPRCHGPTVKRIPRIIAGDKGTGGDPTQPEAQETAAAWVFLCECGQAHPGRPPAEGRYGCGTSWWVSR